MSDTVVVRGSGGAIFEMDIPTAGPARELFDQQLARGDISIVNAPTEWVEVDGAKKLVLVKTPDDEPEIEAPTKKRLGRPPKAATPVVDEDPAPTEE